MEGYTEYEFDNVTALNIAVDAIVKQLSDEYNIFINNIQTTKLETREKEDVNARKECIMRDGFRLLYTSILNTMMYMDKPTATQILDYSYGFEAKVGRVNTVIAIPKTVSINGVEVNFSTPAVEKHVASTLYDVIKPYHMEKEFLAFFVSPEPSEGNKYVLEVNNAHLSKLTPEQKQEFMSNISTRCMKKCNISSGDNKEQINTQIDAQISNMSNQGTYTEDTYNADFDFD